MVAELSNKAFREKLKSRNLWQRIIDSIANLFGFRKDSSNYAKISKNLSNIIDNYDTNFTKNYDTNATKSNFIDYIKKIQGENFTMKEGKTEYPYNAFIEIESQLANELKLTHNEIRASLQYLYNKHPEMFKNKGEVYRTIKELVKDYDMAGDSLKDDTLAYISKTNDNKITDMAINRNSQGVIHLNKDKKARKSQ